MVAPIALGWVVDTYAGISPWGVVAGALFGFVGGIAHLVLITNPKSPKKISGPAKPDQSKPEETR
jgi:F0F1-type ATP synthase assembly protein I